jgi:hypothetical protein
MRKHILTLFFILLSIRGISQELTLHGQITDNNNKPISGVNILVNNNGTSTNSNGYFKIKIKKREKPVTIIFKHLNYKTKKIIINPEKLSSPLQIVLIPSEDKINEITIIVKSSEEKEGAIKLGNMNAKITPGAQKSVENLIKSLPSASGYDEMSNQYMVRGGNFDENQVYINGMEVYRPFLIRSGQQEGLSFINPDLVQSIYFYPGGFSAAKGDKLSSVLDVRYKNPAQNETGIELSLMGGNFYNEWRKSKIGNIIGIRYWDNSLIVNNKDTEVDYKPRFFDFQNLFRYDISPTLYTEFYSNISSNLYRYKPLYKVTNFGSFADAKALVIQYEGQEDDRYFNYFAAIKTHWQPKKEKKYIFQASLYNTQEEEYFDLLGAYNIGTPNTDLSSDNFGQPENLESLGSDLSHARNDLDAFIVNLETIYKQKIGSKSQLESGIKISLEDIKDRINEWQVIDSAGFSLYPPGTISLEEPYDLDTYPIVPYQSTKAFNHVSINRLTFYTLLKKHKNLNKGTAGLNFGLRGQIWNTTDKITNKSKSGLYLSPRLIATYIPHWEQNIEFRFTTGLYQQAPFYKEMRKPDGQLNLDVKAQKTYNISLSTDWYLEWWNRPFKWTSEIYYKYLWDVNPYTIENIRIRYFATNNATAFAYGFESRLNGEFIAGIESWFSLSFMKTMENIDHRGYIYRPTDQRFKFAMLFQDYIPNMPHFRMYLNMVYMDGLPTGSPSYADPYEFQYRTKNYFRSDIGISYILTDRPNNPHWIKKFKHLSLGLEILNMFDARNSISNIWIRDIYKKGVYRIPNYMSGRTFNVKLSMKF